MALLEVLQADVTKLEVDAIANAANTRLLHGGGVAGAISRAGGPAIQGGPNAKAALGLGPGGWTPGRPIPPGLARFRDHISRVLHPSAGLLRKAPRLPPPPRSQG